MNLKTHLGVLFSRFSFNLDNFSKLRGDWVHVKKASEQIECQYNGNTKYTFDFIYFIFYVIFHFQNIHIWFYIST